MALRRLNHVGIAVADIQAADWFLVNVLGLERSSRTPDATIKAAFYKCGPVDIQLVEDAERMKPATIGRIDHMAIDVDDLDELIERLRANGAEFKHETPELDGPPVTKRTQMTLETPGSLGVVFQLTDRNPDVG